MLKVLFLLVVGVSSVFGGWFSSSKIVEKQNLDGENVLIIFNQETNETKFMDDYVADRSQDTYYQSLRDRGNKLFSVIKNFGQKKGFKSFSIQNKWLSTETGFIMDNTEDIVKYCTMGKEYTNFCGGGNGIIQNNSTVYSVEVIFYSDKSGQISF